MRKTVLLLCCAFSSTFLAAQYTPMYPMEIGVQAGASFFLGDLGGQSGVGRAFLRDTDLRATRPAFGIFGRYNFGANFSLRADINYLRLYGDDAYAGRRNASFAGEIRPADGDDAWFRYYRNLNFRSRVWEFSLSGEVIPYNFEIDQGYNGYSVISPYLCLGLGVFNFKPQGLYDGRWVDLQPLATEGQGLVPGRPQYRTTDIMVPLGFGVKWTYNDRFTLGLEVAHRLTFTDYIDDVSTSYVDPSVFFDNFSPDRATMAAAMARRSVEIDPGLVNGVVSAPGAQRGNPKNNDSYYTITLRFAYLFDPKESGGSKRYGCPVW